MPYLVNNQSVPEELIGQESQRISRDLLWTTIPDEAERARRLRAAAESSAIDRMLIEQAAASDPRPMDRDAVEREVQQQKTQWGCRGAFDDTVLRQSIERRFRVERITQEMTAGAQAPSAAEMKAFFEGNRDRFRKPELYHAAHIVKHVSAEQSEERAEAGIQAALAELERGVPFAEVAERYSDCKENGGDLGQFPAGYMVQEFDEAIQALEPGQRTGIFATPFGFHIAELRAKTPPGPASFDDVRGDIERVFVMRNRHELYLRGVAQLRARAEIRWVTAEQPSAV
jgi:peptidyl-prolyl cis-trans isomerase C